MVTLTVIRYRTVFFPFAFLAMVLHRLTLSLNRNISFYKLLGSGKGGSFSAVPSLRLWAVLAVHKKDLEITDPYLGRFIHGWWKLLAREVSHIKMVAVASHGKWDGKEPFPITPEVKSSVSAVITRASIRPARAFLFWKDVAPVSKEVFSQPGLLFAMGIGEAPWFRQGTFSAWDSLEHMKAFAYSRPKHLEVIKKTHKENWYTEDLYTRFAVLQSTGNLLWQGSET